jgi:hypothetical protein
LRIVSSSTVPQAEITHALLIWANACESIATRLRSGSLTKSPAAELPALGPAATR